MHVPGTKFQVLGQNEAMTSSSIRHAVLSLPGLCCCTCAEHVECSLRALQGVWGCRTDLLTRCARVEYDSARCGLTDLVAAIQRAGYQVQSALATAAAEPVTVSALG